jgi:hypothetical protein
MPLPEDKQLLKLSDELVETIRATFDTPKNYRPGNLNRVIECVTCVANEESSPRQTPTRQRILHTSQRCLQTLQSANIHTTLHSPHHAL